MNRSRLRQTRAKSDQRPQVLDKITPAIEFELLKRLHNYQAQLREAGEADKVLHAALRLSLDFFHAPAGCVAIVHPGREKAEILHATPTDSTWDATLLAAFLRGHKVTIPGELMLSRIRRHGRMWGALVLSSGGPELSWDVRRAFSTIGVAATQLVERLSEQRVRAVRARIDHKILEQIGPKDLFYQILHGLRSLVGYDHSAALLTLDNESRTLEVVAEQVAWRKAKSQQVGRTLSLAQPLWDLLARNVVYGFNRDGKAWCDWTESHAAPLAELFDYNRDQRSSATTAEGAMLCAPLVTRHGLVGVLKVASVHPGTFGEYEADIISQFLPQVAVALQNMRRTESLEQRMRAAERKQAMADLARGVSHDVNNALGVVVPLVQQMQEDLANGDLDAATARDDLVEIERSLTICRRIFGGMLSFARGAARSSSEVYLHHAVEGTLNVFREVLERSGVSLEVNVPEDLPPLMGVQADVDQLLLNLIANARDATRDGGRLEISAARVHDRVELTIADNGCGIPPEHMAKIKEPFFTTKTTGSGLGLSICRSIVSQMRGKLQIDSTLGKGTTVRVSIPLDVEAQS